MGILDSLIRIKTNQQEDDLLKMLDEIPVYEKLSRNEKFRDLKNSQTTRAKCPLLAKFIDGSLYETLLADVVANVYLQIEGNVPEVLRTATEKTLKQQKQMDILQSGLVHIQYQDIMEYDHELMGGLLAAVFTKRAAGAAMVVLIVREPGGYRMYHGYYMASESDRPVTNVHAPVVVRGQHGIFTMESYSVLGNNGYRFGSYADMQSLQGTLGVMIGPDGELYLTEGERTVMAYHMNYNERNVLNMTKKNARDFAEAVTSIIESVV